MYYIDSSVSAASDLELITADNRLAGSAEKLGIETKLIVQTST